MSENLYSRILIVDNDSDVLLDAQGFLRQHFNVVHTEKDPENISAILNAENFDLILLNMNFSSDDTSGKEGFFCLSKIHEIDPLAVVVFTTGYRNIELAVQGIKEGACNFILKPWDNKKLLATITAGLLLRRSKQEAEELQVKQNLLIDNQDQIHGNLTGQSPPMQEVLAMVDKVARADTHVLILGENGTEKELLARGIHLASSRRDEIFISVDLSAIDETLLERELFGFKKGAFNDAREGRAGRFETANKGSIFLDEIGNLSPPLQSMLYSVIQNRKVVRVGARQEIPIDVRLICASSKPLLQMVSEGKFRKDLLSRINTMEIHLPPLRERTEDIPALADHFLKIYCKKYRMPQKRISPLSLKYLKKLSWPGNIRELQHAIERAVIMGESNILEPHDFFLPQMADAADDNILPASINLEETEKMFIRKVYDKHGGRIGKAAKELGLTRASLYRRIEKYGL